jgi:two-component system OmpR family sensor kinase
MFKSLQSRLTLSYIIVIVICLALVGLAALVLLRGYQKNLALARLTDRSSLAARLTSEFLQRGAVPRNAVERLARQMSQASDPPVAVYLLNAAGRVVAGSNDALDGQHFPELALRQQTPPAWPARGERWLAGRQQLLYVAEPVYVADEEGQRVANHVLLLAQPYRPVRSALGDLLPRLLWAGGLALALSIVVAALMAYSVARPLDRIARAAEEIAAGNYDQQLDISAPEEVARLAKSFNSMARRVRSTLQSQKDLVANVSHELKTPLTSIQGFSQALVDGAAGDEPARQRAATVIHEEAGRMRRLVDDLLDLARLEAGQVTLAREPLDVGELLRACVSRFALQSEQAGVALELESLPSLAPVVGDADRLGQVFGNLVDNALKHAQGSSGDGRVLLRAEQRDAAVLCSVTDNGPGIPAEELSRIFERFYQVDKSRARSRTADPHVTRGGSGLGLAIAHEIVLAHGGQIHAESVEGLGTRFTVELPARRA